MSRVKIGIIGAGYIGGVHAAIIARDQRAELVMVHDVECERAEHLARLSGARVAGTTQELIDTVDAVYITTPNTKHVELAIAAAGARRHVFCEKPMATDVSEAQAVLDAVQPSNTIFQVGHNRRFAPVYTMLKRLISDGNVPHSAHVKMNRGELINPPWVGNIKLTGGFLFETTIHMLDMMRFLFGEVSEIHGIGSSHEYPEIDDFSFLLRFNSGMHATLTSSADASWLFPFERVEVFCHHRTLATREMETLIYSEGLNDSNVTHSMHQLSKEEKWGYVQEDRAFVDSVLYGGPPPVTAFDGYKSVQLVDACYRSVRNKEPIRFLEI
jgi:myo-inositol 2-dehydrogenase / D-chiro-inositol 1-dehydrogenase